MPSKRTPAAQMAFGGVFGALAVVIMCLGTIIPVATYACPVMCCVILQLVMLTCGIRVAWAWFGAVAILSLLLAPDKEAAAVFLAIGYYPVVKPFLDRRKGKWIYKLFLFNAAILAIYWVMLVLIGMEQLAAEFSDMGVVLTAAMLAMGNVIFLLLDKALDGLYVKFLRKRKRRG